MRRLGRPKIPVNGFSLAHQVGTPIALLLALGARFAVLASPKGSEPRARFRFAFSFLLLHLTLFAAALALGAVDAPLAKGARLGAALSGTLASVTLGSVLVFEGLARRIRPGLPSIVPDLLTMVAAFVAVLHTSSQLGFELSGIIATSAVLTAVVGLAFQDTLGNALGGLALQLDSSIKVQGGRLLRRDGPAHGRATERDLDRREQCRLLSTGRGSLSRAARAPSGSRPARRPGLGKARDRAGGGPRASRARPCARKRNACCSRRSARSSTSTERHRGSCALVNASHSPATTARAWPIATRAGSAPSRRGGCQEWRIEVLIDVALAVAR